MTWLTYLGLLSQRRESSLREKPCLQKISSFDIIAIILVLRLYFISDERGESEYFGNVYTSVVSSGLLWVFVSISFRLRLKIVLFLLFRFLFTIKSQIIRTIRMILAIEATVSVRFCKECFALISSSCDLNSFTSCSNCRSRILLYSPMSYMESWVNMNLSR